ncbi:hypothetical protein MBCUT_07160 [Methanobrevibacter cuticularis]|uniref:Uncharacterized protein n=1 Tax=Methanobrevibacter cuticularis TaxID=47311 RepID=A0A166EEG3_9EURY|nr:hypothetical protein [Methanobrevibacter cuticularis]KZX16562.1 hypothetical protein MBCUT_07160 [Methanobrevibacter cuticularis]
MREICNWCRDNNIQVVEDVSRAITDPKKKLETVKMLVAKKNFFSKNQVFVNSSLKFNFKNCIN